jgi:hypothetical protein
VFGVNEALWRVELVSSVGGSIRIVRFVSTRAQGAVWGLGSLDVTVTNVGDTQLNFTSITITGTKAGDFSQTNTCGASITAGASCIVTVTFKPTAKGSRSAVLRISDDGGGSPQTVNLTGTGT